VSESSVYRILKAADLITSPAYVLMSASDAFKNPTTRVHEMWQTDFTYFRIVGWGWYYLSTVLDDFSRYIIAWKRNVKRWQGGSMVVRWVSAAIVEAEKKFRRVHGWRDIEKLVRALDLIEAKEEATAERVA
jgi:hypothetical protein